jgi:hypothetical protein
LLIDSRQALPALASDAQQAGNVVAGRFADSFDIQMRIKIGYKPCRYRASSAIWC